MTRRCPGSKTVHSVFLVPPNTSARTANVAKGKGSGIPRKPTGSLGRAVGIGSLRRAHARGGPHGRQGGPALARGRRRAVGSPRLRAADQGRRALGRRG